MTTTKPTSDLLELFDEEIALNLPGFSSFSAAAYDDGREFENERLMPMLKAVRLCIEALERGIQWSISQGAPNSLASNDAREALTALRAALEKGKA